MYSRATRLPVYYHEVFITKTLKFFQISTKKNTKHYKAVSRDAPIAISGISTDTGVGYQYRYRPRVLVKYVQTPIPVLRSLTALRASEETRQWCGNISGWMSAEREKKGGKKKTAEKQIMSSKTGGEETDSTTNITQETWWKWNAIVTQ